MTGYPALVSGQMPNVLNGIELGLMVCLPASSARACSSVLSLFILLQMSEPAVSEAVWIAAS